MYTIQQGATMSKRSKWGACWKREGSIYQVWSDWVFEKSLKLVEDIMYKSILECTKLQNKHRVVYEQRDEANENFQAIHNNCKTSTTLGTLKWRNCLRNLLLSSITSSTKPWWGEWWRAISLVLARGVSNCLANPKALKSTKYALCQCLQVRLDGMRCPLSCSHGPYL